MAQYTILLIIDNTWSEPSQMTKTYNLINFANGPNKFSQLCHISSSTMIQMIMWHKLNTSAASWWGMLIRGSMASRQKASILINIRADVFTSSFWILGLIKWPSLSLFFSSQQLCLLSSPPIITKAAPNRMSFHRHDVPPPNLMWIHTNFKMGR